MRRTWTALASVLVAVTTTGACSRAAKPDAYGNVEATEVVVGAEATGRLVSFDVTEGRKLDVDAIVGSIDSTELALERDQLTAQRGANSSRVNEVARQIDVLQAQRDAAAAQRDAARAQKAVLEAQHDVARRAYERTRRLFDQQAATAQQLDQAERDYRVLEQQIKAQDEQIAAHEHQVAAQREQIDATRAQRQTAAEQVTSIDAQVARVNERIRKSQVRNPVAGTVLATYARAGEVVQPGQPLYKIANLAAVDVRAYVGENQLAQVHLGSDADVAVDAGSGTLRTLKGKVTWISSQAEFTPTPIQTREERADLVYAVKIRVANDEGVLKVGMPADVRFSAGQ
ncbi:MAG TPA: efflux RND transporter periplasmic adaptor subunit [Vicinamibacterales bacterium]|jgi:HlyD family secretion protein